MTKTKNIYVYNELTWVKMATTANQPLEMQKIAYHGHFFLSLQ